MCPFGVLVGDQTASAAPGAWALKPRDVLHAIWNTQETPARIIEVLTEPLAAILVVIDVGILGSGVFSRYVLHNALVWSDELATLLFLWLAMLGAVSAMRRRMRS